MLRNKSAKFKKGGFSVMEIVVASAIMLLVAVAVSDGFTKYVVIARSNNNSVKALYLLDEGVEIMKIMRDKSWSTNIASLATSTPFYVDRTTEEVTSSPVLIGNLFDRKITIEDVCKNEDGSIADCPAQTVATDTKKIIVSVGWNNGNGTTTKTLYSYIKNLFNN